MAIRICSVAGCRNEISPRSRLDECPACRAYLIAYLKASPARVMERRQKIHLYDSRLQVIMPGDPDELDDIEDTGVKLQAPANYRPQSDKGKSVLKKHPPKSTPPKKRANSTNNRAHATA